ncbi:MAG: stage 0 sporulation family protein [Clostridiales bacterium]|nr:stage 0 sporulation family protein [Clostridiales bacterium]
MNKAIAVKFRTSQKHYYFDPGDIEVKNGDFIIVETSRGLEIGVVRGGVAEKKRQELGRNLKKILRLATEEDKEAERQNLTRRNEAIALCKERIEAFGLDMKLIDAEYTFDGSKLIFYFSAEKRVDFRDLVKDLASHFHMRIELRQIGVRDEARILGGFGNCGRELCCKGWLQDFEPVSIKMAKVQNLSLNPGKISGSCGRLMCCLKYENDIYQELKKGLPNPGETIDAPIGKAKVMDVSIFNGTVRVKRIEEERTKDCPERLGDEVFEYGKDEIHRRRKITKNGVASEFVDREIVNALKDDLISVVVEEES